MRGGGLQRMAISVGVIALALAGCGKGAERRFAGVGAGKYAPIQEELAKSAEAYLAKRPKSSMSIALVDAGEIVWAQSFGFADAESNTPATTETFYRAAGLSKPLTALALVQLAERHKIDLDAPLTKYLPDFSIINRFEGARPFTIRDMMCHHSGLPSDYLRGYFRLQPMPLADLAAAMKDEYLAAPPGTVYSYSNAAYGLLGYLIERVTGKPYDDYMRQAVFDPAGIETASYALDAKVVKKLAKIYGSKGEVMRLPSRSIASEGLYASVLDLARFVRLILCDGKVGGRPIVSAAGVEQMLTPQNADCPGDNGYLIGLDWVLTWPDLEYMGRIAWHDGPMFDSSNGFILLSLDYKLGVVVLTSGGTENTVRRVAHKAMEMAVEIKAGIAPPNGGIEIEEPVLPQSPQDVAAIGAASTAEPELKYELDPRLLETLPGYYGTYVGLIEVRRAGNNLQGTAYGYLGDLLPGPAGRFSFRYRLGGLIPIPLPFLKDYGLTFYEGNGRQFLMAHEGPKVTIGARVEPVPIPDAWLKRLGTYKVVNRGDDYHCIQSLHLAKMDQFLVMDIMLSFVSEMAAETLLVPLSDTDAVTGGMGRRQGDRVNAIEVDGEERVRYSGYEFAHDPEGDRKGWRRR